MSGEAGAADGPIPHGGDLAAARALFPDAPGPWVDLSTGINPHPYPLPPFPASALARLPSPEDLAALRAIAANVYTAPGASHVAAAPGTQILIETVPRLYTPRRVAVVGPTYAEHAAAWRRAGHCVATVPDLAAAEAAGAEMIVAVSPNNPDGRVLAAADILECSQRLGARGGLLVLDRAFADLEPDPGPEPRLGPGLAVLRSFGKTYGLAGLRLGFLLADPPLVARVAAALGPWAVSGPALFAGRTALPDTAWLRAAAEACRRDAARLDRMIRRADGRVVGGTALFRTADFTDGPAWFHRLGEAGVFVRRFPEAPARLRFGLPPDKGAWCRLSRVLRPG